VKRILGLALTVALAAQWLAPSGATARPAYSAPRTTVPATSRVDPSGSSGRVPGEVIVSYAASADRFERMDLRDEVGARARAGLALANTEVVQVPAGTVDEAIDALESSPDVVFAEPNYYLSASAIPSDPRFAQEWGLNNTGQSISGTSGTADADIDAPEGWEFTTGSSDVVVAIVDTGVAYNHPDLASNIWSNPGETGGTKATNGVDDDGNGKVDDWRGWDFIDRDNTPRDLYGHGTHVAGIVGATGNDAYGVAGVAWDVSLMPLRVLDADGSGTTTDVADAVTYASAKGADVINLSLGGPEFSQYLLNAIAAATNTLIVVAAGNESANNEVTSSYPCNYPGANIVCVAATDYNDNLAGYSNYGVVSVDLAAPGSRILSTVPPFLRPLKDGFESGLTGWTTGGTGTAWTSQADSLGQYITDSSGANYLSNTDSWIATTSATSLADQQNCRLTYAFQLDTERNTDYLNVEASTNGTSWTSVGGWSGSSGADWLTGSHDLTAYDGSSVYIRFRLTSNALLNYAGASVDDVEIRCLGVNFTGTEFSYFSGTSMATPNVSGAAALMLSAAPDSTVAELKTALLTSVDPKTGLAGKMVAGGRLNVAKAIVAIAPDVTPHQVPTIPPLPTVSPSPSSSASATPSASPTPTPTPSPTAPIDIPVVDRHVSLRLAGHLVLSGRIYATDGFPACLSNIPVQIKRNGSIIKVVSTNTDGYYITQLRDLTGRYGARILKTDLPGELCRGDSSVVRHHRHH
jgi:subtilisin family serine protease